MKNEGLKFIIRFNNINVIDDFDESCLVKCYGLNFD